ncbi:carboxylesterase, partial [Leptodontidium sp. 2 PMI_412]
MKFITLIIVPLSASLITAQFLHRRQDSCTVPTVKTTSGFVSGHPASNSTCVSEYLGIPFANPPIGELRFAPPEPYTGNTSIDGKNFGFSCLAIASPTVSAQGNVTAAGASVLSLLGQSDLAVNEDCLTLNVWVPSGGEEKKAVLLWIFGGGNVVGGASLPMYSGQYISEQGGVIVVTINYRLNIFGFPGNPTEPNANLGFLDQRLAVKWTRDNIPAFGGDASRITLFGQSAGSAAIDSYSYAYTEEPIIAGIILQSGFANQFTQIPRTVGERSWFYVTNALGCGDSSSDPNKVLQCMRTKNSSDILAFAPPFAGAAPGNGTFGPVVDNITVVSDMAARSRAGNFVKVPVLMGITNHEVGLFQVLSTLSNVTQTQAYWDNFSRTVFECPSSARANISIQQDVPTWKYRYFGDWPDMQLMTSPDAGSWHTIDVLAIFNYSPEGPGIPGETSEQIASGRYVRGAWAAFARDPKEGLTRYEGGWPMYDPGRDTLVRLAYNNMAGMNLGNPSL